MDKSETLPSKITICSPKHECTIARMHKCTNAQLQVHKCIGHTKVENVLTFKGYCTPNFRQIFLIINIDRKIL